MSSPNFREAILNWAPWYLKGSPGQNGAAGYWGQRLLESIGYLLDCLADQVEEGRRAVLPQTCQEDVLPYFSADRDLELYETEPVASKRDRLAHAWPLHRLRGTALGIMEHVQPYFLDQPALPRIRVVSQDQAGFRAQWWTRNPDGTVERHVQAPSNWNWESSTEKLLIPGGRHWARAWVIIYTEGTYLDTSCIQYGDGHLYGDGSIYGGIAAQVRRDLIRMIVAWRAAHEQIWGIALARDSASFDPTATAITFPDGSTSLPTGNPSWRNIINPATNQRSRLVTATWIYDRVRDGAQ